MRVWYSARSVVVTLPQRPHTQMRRNDVIWVPCLTTFSCKICRNWYKFTWARPFYFKLVPDREKRIFFPAKKCCRRSSDFAFKVFYHRSQKKFMRDHEVRLVIGHRRRQCTGYHRCLYGNNNKKVGVGDGISKTGGKRIKHTVADGGKNDAKSWILPINCSSWFMLLQ